MDLKDNIIKVNIFYEEVKIKINTFSFKNVKTGILSSSLFYYACAKKIVCTKNVDSYPL